MTEREFVIPLSAPDITSAEIEAVTAVLRSDRLCIGPKTEEFEQCIASYVGVPHAVALSSGTAALHLAVRALGIGEGDEVIVPSFAFVAVAHAVRYERAVPVFVDIDPLTLNMDPAAVERAITSRTRAILVVHTFGCPAEMQPILDIARRHNLRVIEDACEALGAEYHGKKAGQFGDIGDGNGIAIQVAVDGWPVATAADGHFHAIAIVGLPEKAIGSEMAGLPGFVIVYQIGQQFLNQAGVAADEVA